MRKYWLLDEHGQDGPTALVETDGRMQIVRILRFGPGITELADQQEIQDRVMGKLAPTMKLVPNGPPIGAGSVEPHADLSASSMAGSGKANRADRRSAGQRGQTGRVGGGGPSRSGGRGDR